MIADLDRHVGRVLAALEKAGVADRTMIVFTSDNGATHPVAADPRFHAGGAAPNFFTSTANLRGYKGSVHEGGIRVPMIARWPGKIPVGVNDTPGYFADWFPTLCDAFGLAKPDGLDGESLWQVLTTGKSQPRTKPLIWVFPEYTGQVAVRLGNLKAVRKGLATKKPGRWEVYDLAIDPGETNDLAAQQGEFTNIVEELLRKEVAENKVYPLNIPGVTK
jgi:arylsulfatase A